MYFLTRPNQQGHYYVICIRYRTVHSSAAYTTSEQTRVSLAVRRHCRVSSCCFFPLLLYMRIHRIPFLLYRFTSAAAAVIPHRRYFSRVSPCRGHGVPVHLAITSAVAAAVNLFVCPPDRPRGRPLERHGVRALVLWWRLPLPRAFVMASGGLPVCWFVYCCRSVFFGC